MDNNTDLERNVLENLAMTGQSADIAKWFAGYKSSFELFFYNLKQHCKLKA